MTQFRTILEGEDEGFVKVHVKKGTDKIVGATNLHSRLVQHTLHTVRAFAEQSGCGTDVQFAGAFHGKSERCGKQIPSWEIAGGGGFPLERDSSERPILSRVLTLDSGD